MEEFSSQQYRFENTRHIYRIQLKLVISLAVLYAKKLTTASREFDNDDVANSREIRVYGHIDWGGRPTAVKYQRSRAMPPRVHLDILTRSNRARARKTLTTCMRVFRLSRLASRASVRVMVPTSRKCTCERYAAVRV